jgi:hypothetical protein
LNFRMRIAFHAVFYSLPSLHYLNTRTHTSLSLLPYLNCAKLEAFPFLASLPFLPTL